MSEAWATVLTPFIVLGPPAIIATLIVFIKESEWYQKRKRNWSPSAAIREIGRIDHLAPKEEEKVGKKVQVILSSKGITINNDGEITDVTVDDKGNIHLHGDFKIVNEKTEGMKQLDEDD